MCFQTVLCRQRSNSRFARQLAAGGEINKHWVDELRSVVVNTVSCARSDDEMKSTIREDEGNLKQFQSPKLVQRIFSRVERWVDSGGQVSVSSWRTQEEKRGLKTLCCCDDAHL